MTETKIDEHVKASEFLPKGYTRDIRKDRCKGGGRVMIAMKQEYNIQGKYFGRNCLGDYFSQRPE